MVDAHAEKNDGSSLKNAPQQDVQVAFDPPLNSVVIRYEQTRNIAVRAN